MRRRAVSALALSGAFACTPLLASASPQDHVPPVAPPVASVAPDALYGLSKCVRAREYGQRYWVGSSRLTRAVASAGWALQAVVDAHPSEGTGVSLCSHYEGVEIFLKSKNSSLLPAIAKIKKSHPTALIHVTPVGRSQNDLLKATSIAMDTLPPGTRSASAAPDTERGGIEVGLYEPSIPPMDVVRGVSPLAKKIRAALPGVPIAFIPIEQARHA